MSSESFTLVGKKSNKIIEGCNNCKKNRDPQWTQHSTKECPQVICNWCKAIGHIKSACEKFQAKLKRDEEKRAREERIANMTCNWCKEKGHGWNFCEKRKESFRKKEEKQKKMDKDFPATLAQKCAKPVVISGWTSVAKQNRNEKIVEKIKIADEKIAKKKKEEKEKAHADYLERERLREERQKVEDALYVEKMREKFGTHWFNWLDVIEGGKYDSAIASKLRDEYQEEEYQREHDYEDMIQKADYEAYEREKQDEAEDEEKQRTLSPQAYRKWRREKDDEFHDELDTWLEQGSMNWQLSEIRYLENAPPLYREHYRKTCQQLDWNQKILENRKLSLQK
jgi:hypothetical protein